MNSREHEGYMSRMGQDQLTQSQSITKESIVVTEQDQLGGSEAVAPIMERDHGTFIDITEIFPEITRRYCELHTTVAISSGINRMIQEHCWITRGFTYRDAIHELMMRYYFCDTTVHLDWITVMHPFTYLNDTEVWAYSELDQLGRFSLKILLPWEAEQE